MLLELQRLGAQIERGLKDGALEQVLPGYCLYRAGAEQILRGQGLESYWGFKRGVYSIGSLVQRSLAELVATGDEQTIREIISSSQGRIPKIAASEPVSVDSINEWFRTTITGASGTAVAATFLERFIEKGWKCADVDLDIDYAVDCYFESGATVQSKVNNANNYRGVNKLQRKIFQDGTQMEIPIVRLTHEDTELQLAPLAIINVVDSSYFMPSVLHRVEGEKKLFFARPKVNDSDDIYLGVAQAIEEVADHEAMVRAYERALETQRDLIPSVFEDESQLWANYCVLTVPYNDTYAIERSKLRELAGVIPEVDNFDILMRVKQLPKLTAFGKDLVRAVLLSLKINWQERGNVSWTDSRDPVYYIDTALFDLKSGKKPDTLEYASSATQFVRGIRNLNDYEFIKPPSYPIFVDPDFEREELSSIEV